MGRRIFDRRRTPKLTIASSAQAIPRAGRMLPAKIAGIATPVEAAIHAARQRGHFGNRIAITPGIALPPALSQRRAGRLSELFPRAEHLQVEFTTAPV
jgi:hypothetical protein